MIYKNILIALVILSTGCSSHHEISKDSFTSRVTSGPYKSHWYNYVGSSRTRTYLERESISTFSGPTNKTLFYVEHDKLSEAELENLREVNQAFLRKTQTIRIVQHPKLKETQLFTLNSAFKNKQQIMDYLNKEAGIKYIEFIDKESDPALLSTDFLYEIAAFAQKKGIEFTYNKNAKPAVQPTYLPQIRIGEHLPRIIKCD